MDSAAIGNEYLGIGGISSNALYVHCHMSQYMNHERQVRSTYPLIAEDVILCKKQADNRKRIKEALVELEEKSLVSTEVTYNDHLRITLTKEWDEKFTQLPYAYLTRTTPDELRVISYILRWAFAKNRISLDEWMRVLDLSYVTTQKRLKEMQEKNLIHIQSGNYFEVAGGWRQDINKYRIDDKYGEDAARDLARKQGYALMGEYEKVLGEDDLALAKKAFYEEDGMVYCRDVSGYGMEQRKKFLDGVKQKENRK